MFAASLEFSIWTAPLCLFLILAVRAAAKISTEHEIASLHDALTGLPNRTLMLTRLNESLAEVDDERQAALLMIDLDHFKEINDSLGHATGDELLTLVAGRLKQEVGPGDTVARLGGDEFAIVVDDATPDEAEALAPAGDRHAEPVVPAGRADARRGRERRRRDGATARHRGVDALIRNGDQALYSAKGDRGRYMVYNPATAEQRGGQPGADERAAARDRARRDARPTSSPRSACGPAG